MAHEPGHKMNIGDKEKDTPGNFSEKDTNTIKKSTQGKLAVKTHPKYGFTYRTREERAEKLTTIHRRMHGRGRGTAGGGNSGQQG